MLAELEGILTDLGTQLLQWRALGQTDGEWVGSQLKAEADRRAHAYLVGELERRWPDIPVISEEDSASQHDARPYRYWLIDPIDGTASFCGGFAGFVTQAALIEDRRPVIGVVHAPALSTTWRAERGSPASRNGAVIRVAPASAERVLVDNYPEPRGFARDVFEALHFDRYVESGSIGLKICRVAEGTAHLFPKDIVVRDWDLAPADLILARAGGALTTLSGDEVSYSGSWEKHGVLAASSPDLIREVVDWRLRGRTTAR